MANISTLTVSLVAETAKFTNGLKKSRKQANDFSRVIAKSFKLAAAGATALTVSLGALTKQSLALVDQQRKTARSLGTTQAVYSGLSLAAGISGVSVESFGKALRRQQKSIVDANDGLATQARAFERLNLDTQALINLPVEQQFNKIIAALGNVENATLRSATASDIFGARNADLINAIGLGEEGLNKYLRTVEDLGVALNTNQTDAIEEANDAVLIFQTAIRGLGNQLAAAFAPALTRAATALANFVGRIAQGIEGVSRAVRRFFDLQRDLNTLSLDGLRDEYRITAEELRDNLLQQGELQARITRGIEGGTLSGRNLQARRNSLDLLISRGKQLTGILEDAQKAADGLALEVPGTVSGEDVAGVPNAGPGRRSFFETDSASRQEFEANIALFDEYARRAQAAFTSTRTPLEALELKIADIQKQLIENPFFDGELAQRETQAAVDVYLSELDRLAGGSEEAFGAVNEFANQAARNIQDGFAEFLFDPFDEGLDGLLKGFGDTLRKIVAELASAQILRSVFGLFGAGNLISIPGRRIGGPTTGRPTLVGEGGPEIFTPGATGSVRPLGAVTINQTVNIGGDGGSLSPGTLIPILDENNRKLKAELLDEFDRGAFA